MCVRASVCIANCCLLVLANNLTNFYQLHDAAETSCSPLPHSLLPFPFIIQFFFKEFSIFAVFSLLDFKCAAIDPK